MDRVSDRSIAVFAAVIVPGILLLGVFMLALLLAGCPAQGPIVRPSLPPPCVGAIGFDHPLMPPAWTEDNLDCRICDSASGCIAPGNWYCIDKRTFFDGRCTKQPLWERQRHRQDGGLPQP